MENSMLSRAADSLFWMGRYIERAEDMRRVLTVNHFLSLDRPAGLQDQWMPLVNSAGEDKLFAELYGEATQVNVVRFLLADRRNPVSLVSCMYQARENARAVREKLPTEFWEAMNTAFLRVNDAADETASNIDAHADPFPLLEEMRGLIDRLMGIFFTGFSQGEAFHFARLGLYLERADQATRMVDVKYFILLPSLQEVGGTMDLAQWEALLRSASALEMYRQKHQRITIAKVLEFLLLDREFPRAALFCLRHAEESLRLLTGNPAGSFSNPAEKEMGRLIGHLSFCSPDDVVKTGLHEFLEDVQMRIQNVTGAIYATFINQQSTKQSAFQSS